jgi:tetratricopeptide (TPR) repeat protein
VEKNKFLYIIAFVIMLLTACGGNQYDNRLIIADSLADTAPDSAVHYLKLIRKPISRLSEANCMYYRLLCIKAADKDYIPQKSDREILQLVDYYEHGGDKDLLPIAYYYAGSAYRDLNDAPKAVTFFYKAADALPKDADLKLRSNIYNQTGQQLKHQGLYSDALKMLKLSYSCDSMLKDTMEMINSFRDIGNAYEFLDQIDISFIYYKRAYLLAKKTKNKDRINEILGQMALYYYDSKQYDMAEKCMQPELANIDSGNISPIYSLALEIYMAKKDYAAARYYCNKLDSFGTIYAKKYAKLCKLKLDFISENNTKAVNDLCRYEKNEDSVNCITKTIATKEAYSISSNRHRDNERVPYLLIIGEVLLTAACASAVIVISMLLLVYFNEKARHEILNAPFLYKIIKPIDIAGKLSRYYEEEEAKRLLTDEQCKQKINKEKIEKLKETTIYKKLLTDIEKDKVLTDKDIEELDNEINNIFAHFRDNLFVKYSLSKREYEVCLLIRCGIDINGMGILVGCTPCAVSKIRTRLQKRIFGNNGNAKDFDEFVNSL